MSNAFSVIKLKAQLLIMTRFPGFSDCVSSRKGYG